MSTIWSTVDCCEVHGTLSENWTGDSFTASVTLKCAWDDRFDLISDLLGNSYPYLAGWGQPPICNGAGSVPMPTDYEQANQGIDYTHALVTASYTTKEPEELYTESIEPIVEFITLDYKRFRWGSPNGDPLLEAEAPGRQMRSCNLVRTIKKAASVPASALTLPGHVNDTAYTSTLLGLTFAVETLLFTPAALTRTIDTAGDTAWDMTLKMGYMPQTWNKFFRAKSGTYEEIYDTQETGAYKSYPLGDFSDWLS